MDYPLFLGSQRQFSNRFIDVTNKFSGALIGRVAAAEPSDIEKAIGIAVAAREKMVAFTEAECVAILKRCAAVLQSRRGTLA